jgi:hypothetical protein
MWARLNVYRVLVGKPDGKTTRKIYKSGGIILRWDAMDWINLTE